MRTPAPTKRQPAPRRGGRVVECTALEMRHRCKPIGGSNPPLSARLSVSSCLRDIHNPLGLFADLLIRMRHPRTKIHCGYRWSHRNRLRGLARRSGPRSLSRESGSVYIAAIKTAYNDTCVVTRALRHGSLHCDRGLIYADDNYSLLIASGSVLDTVSQIVNPKRRLLPGRGRIHSSWNTTASNV